MKGWITITIENKTILEAGKTYTISSDGEITEEVD